MKSTLRNTENHFSVENEAILTTCLIKVHFDVLLKLLTSSYFLLVPLLSFFQMASLQSYFSNSWIFSQLFASNFALNYFEITSPYTSLYLICLYSISYKESFLLSLSLMQRTLIVMKIQYLSQDLYNLNFCVSAY